METRQGSLPPDSGMWVGLRGVGSKSVVQVHFSPKSFRSVGEMDIGHADRHDSQILGNSAILPARQENTGPRLIVDACVNVCDLDESI